MANLEARRISNVTWPLDFDASMFPLKDLRMKANIALAVAGPERSLVTIPAAGVSKMDSIGIPGFSGLPGAAFVPSGEP